MYKKEMLENSVTVVYEQIPHVRSVSFGIWIGTGSRYESEYNNGVSHFIEHMLFKGTNNRTAKEIAEGIDNIGGQINAFTGKECTCFYTKTLDTDLEIAVDILSDMLFNSLYTKKDTDTERKVILEEIGMYEDYPEEMVYDILSESIWNGNPLGYPILGTGKSLLAIDHKTIMDYVNDFYVPENCVISVVGNFDCDDLMETIKKYFGNWKTQSVLNTVHKKPDFKSCLKIKKKDTEQVHLCIGFNGIEHGDDRLYSLLVVNNILGGGMSSRLFQKIREEKGLAYSIYAYPSSYRDSGLFTIYAATNPSQLDEVLKNINEEIDMLLLKGISEEDIEKAKSQLKGSYILGLDSTSSRMNSIGKTQLLLGRIKTPEEVLQKVDEINTEMISDIISRTFDKRYFGISLIGDLDEEKVRKSIVHN